MSGPPSSIRTSAVSVRPLLAGLLCLSAAAAAQSRAPETEPVLAAADLAQSTLLSGPGYTAQPHAPMVGFMARFTLDTDAGPIVADSVELLEVRATEMAAIAILDRVLMSEAFGIALREALGDAADTVGHIVTHPVSTLAGLPAGVLRYFGRQLGKWGERFSKHGDRIAYRTRNDGDPYDMLGPMNANRDAQPPRRKKRWFTKPGKEALRLVKDWAKYGGAKRMLARELGIDPYSATTNPALNERLNRLAWAAAAGKMSIGEVMGYLPTGGRAVLDESGRLNELVWALEPEDLRRRNRAVLERWCGDDFQIRRFVRHGTFLGSVQTRFADALDALAPAAGCEHVLDLALAADYDVEARFVANALQMASGHFGDAARGARLDAAGAGLFLTLPDGRKVLPLPIDYLSWTALADDFFRQRELLEGERTVLIAGTLSDRALRELTALGWEIVVRTPFAGAPPYAARCCA